jgi:hypothetical protein
MAAFNKFESFLLALAEGKHNLSTGQMKIALTNTLPTSGNDVLADITEIAYTNLSSRNVTTASSAQTAGQYKLTLTDLVLTATGTVATWRYVVLYNDTATNDELIGWWDRGSEVIMSSGDEVTLDFDGSLGVIRIGA